MKLTLPQEDIYFEQLMYPEDPIYNIGAKIFIQGEIIFDVLNQAYKVLIQQHDAYRSILKNSENGVEIIMLDTHDTTLKFVDFSNVEKPDEEANDFMQKRFQQPFKLDSGELLHEFILVKVSENSHYLFSVYHHIITDGWGTSLMFQRLVKNYNELIESNAVITEYPFSYKDFVANDQEYLLSEDYSKDKGFWKEQFRSLPEPLFKKIKNNGKSNESRRKEIYLKREQYNKLNQTAKEIGVSTFHLILAILYLYFGRKHQNTDFAIGLPVLNRGKSVFKKTVGLFMGLSLLRMKFETSDSFEIFAKNIKQKLRENYRYQRFPLGKLIKELEVFQEKERLCNMTLSYERQNYADHFCNTKTTVIPLTHHSERAALAVYIREFDENENVKIDFDYNLNYFDENSITQVTSHFLNLIPQVIEDTNKPLFQYEYISKEEKEELLVGFNATKFSYPERVTTLDLFKGQVNRNPSKVALLDNNVRYLYSDLDRLSDRVASYLLDTLEEKMNSNAVPVAVLMDRSANLVVTLLGILKSGNSFIPIDPDFPKERIQYILDHSGVKEIIGTQDLKDKFVFDKKITPIEPILERDYVSASLEAQKISPEDTAYIIYTSGSTGNPKGVVVNHEALFNFLFSMQNKPGIDAKDFLFSVTTQSFDISILEFFGPLISGATLYVASPYLLTNPLELVAELGRLKPTIIQATPSFYQMLYNAGWKGDPNLKALCGGDLLSEMLAEKLINTNLVLWNMYGPTETTIWSSCKRITKANESSNIGKPIHNTKFYILDKDLQLLPKNNEGYLYIGGAGLAKEYFKNDKLTNEKFIASPFSDNEKLYNTGDLGKWNNQGEIRFLGRDDHQVKIRGFRIELGEVETKLNQLDEVHSSVVIAQKKKNQEAVLVAYIIPNSNQFDPEPILDALKAELPEYMIPYIIIPLKEFPLTPNNKVDRKVLGFKKLNKERTISLSKLPKTKLEIALSVFYMEVLEIPEKISVEDNFFHLGGHSLNAVKLINLIDEELQFKLTLKDIFDYPNIKSLTKYLNTKKKRKNISIPLLDSSNLYPLTPAQHSIWLASQKEERSIAYNMPAVFNVTGALDKKVLEKVLLQIVRKHEVLRTNFGIEKGIPKQKIRPAKDIEISISEFFPSETVLDETIRNFVNTAFDLENEVLLKVGLVHKSRQQFYLVFNTHHIIMDGWSIEVLIKEIVENYAAISKGIDALDYKLSFQFKDYTSWYHNQQVKNNNRNEKFWNKYLTDYKWKNNIPFDNELNQEQNIGATFNFVFSSLKLPELNKVVQEHKISHHTLFASVFNILLYKMYNREDVCIGTVNTGRTISTLQHHLGMFVKTLPLRITLSSEMSFKQLVQQVHENILEIDKHQDLPPSLQNKIKLDTLLVMQNPSLDYDNIQLNENLSLKLYPTNTLFSRLPLLLTFVFQQDVLNVKADYNLACYEAITIELLMMKFEKLLFECIKNPNTKIGSINFDLEVEKAKTIDIDFDF